MPNLSAAKRIVFTTWGSYGDIHPYMALALELRARGHHASIATSSVYREKVEAAGIGFHPVRPDLPLPDTAESIEIARRALDMREGPRYVMSELLAPHTRDTYTDTLEAIRAEGGADLLVSHAVPLAAPLVAEKTGVAWVSTVLAPISLLSAYDPPTPPQFPPLHNLLRLHPSIARPLLDVAERSTRPWTAPVRRLRAELGLGVGRNPIFAGQHSPTRVLALFSKVLARVQRDYPPNTLITGFPFYDRRDELPPSPELVRFLDAGEPPVLFTLGSSAVWVARDFYRTSVEAARQLGRRALLLIGDGRNLPAKELPEGVAAFDYAPHSLVMPRAAAVVHQGGVGTTGQALRSGRPMLVVPFGQDQPDNARRCVALGVGRSLASHRYTTERAVRELRELLGDSNYAERAADVGREVREEGGAEKACDALEELLDVKRDTSDGLRIV